MSYTNIDNDFFDRQIRTYGAKSTKKFSETKVGVIGLGQSFASEVLKNLAISGFRHFYLFDITNVTREDVKHGYYYFEEDMKKKRFDVIKSKINNLNPTTIITKGEDTTYNELDIMVLLNQSFEVVINFEKKFKGKLIVGFCTGINGLVFCNPKEHITNDINGENIVPHNIKSVSFNKENKTMLIETITKHDLSYGDKVSFKNMILSSPYTFNDSYDVNVINVYKFSISFSEDISFINGSVLKKVNTVTFNNYKSFEKTLDNPTFEGFDIESSQKVFDSYKYINKFIQPQLMPFVSIIGSLVSNEVIKLSSDKFTPINQILTFHDSALEKITSNGELPDDLLEKISNKNYNMVGCGAIGCELLKNLAMIGAAKNGFFRITDPDHIEKSNLSRQFLFRNHHVGHSKAKIAAMMVQDFGKMNIETFENKITSKDETFTNKFFERSDIIFNALDNLSARKYVDSIAFKYNLPLFESGTMGMKGNTQPVIPMITETYSDSTDAPDEDSFPICTIKNFPNMIQHTIHHARDYFEFFNRAPTNVNMYLTDSKYIESLTGIEKNTAIKDINMFGTNFTNWFDCAEFAYNSWYKNFNYSIKQLLNSFPSDKLTTDGTLFWSKGKRCPTPLKFDSSNEYHSNYIISHTRILCNICNINHVNVTNNMILENLGKYNLEKFKVDNKKKAAETDEEMKKQETSVSEVSIKKDIELNKYYSPQEFEKDDDVNYHVQFITASSNCRAENYGIPVADFNKTKGIAGKIIPAVATTTALVAGLIVLEMIKYVASVDNIEDYKSYFVNLALNIFVGGEPIAAKKIVIGDKELNVWTKFEQTEDMKLETFLEKWSKVLETDVNMIFSGSKIIYSDFTNSDKSQTLSSIIKDKFKMDPFNTTEEWIISSDDYEDLPSINIVLKKNERLNINI